MIQVMLKKLTRCKENRTEICFKIYKINTSCCFEDKSGVSLLYDMAGISFIIKQITLEWLNLSIESYYFYFFIPISVVL